MPQAPNLQFSLVSHMNKRHRQFDNDAVVSDAMDQTTSTSASLHNRGGTSVACFWEDVRGMESFPQFGR